MTLSQRLLGQTLAARYRLDKEVGRGGMATVFLAQDLKHGRSVALKVMRAWPRSDSMSSPGPG